VSTQTTLLARQKETKNEKADTGKIAIIPFVVK
jgi:hypothetical protein